MTMPTCTKEDREKTSNCAYYFDGKCGGHSNDAKQELKWECAMEIVPEIFLKQKSTSLNKNKKSLEIEERNRGVRSMIEMNQVILGNNLEVMRELPSNFIDLCYVDPPFFKNRDFGEFNDEWKSIDDYLKFIRDRLVEIHRLLKSNGSIYVHCDYSVNAYMRIEIEKIFKTKIISEIIWKRKFNQATNQHPRNFGNDHDTIFLYSKGDDYTFKRLKRKVEASNYSKDEKGYFKSAPLVKMSKEAMEKRVSIGNAWKSDSGNFRCKRYLEVENDRVIDKVSIDDVWIDIPNMQHVRLNERTHYPTQKPEQLLERIIMSSSNEGDVILDPFCGSGTTLVVAKRLRRNFIGIDINSKAIEISRNRLENHVIQGKIVKGESNSIEKWLK